MHNIIEHNNVSRNQTRKNTHTINEHIKLVGFLTFVSRILGFVRIGVLGALFGASGLADILNLVLSIPNNLRKLLAEGALQNAYMPIFARLISKDTSTKKNYLPANKLLLEVLVYFGLFTFLIAFIMSIFSRPIVQFLFDLSHREEIVLAGRLFSLAIYFLLLISITSILSGVLQIRRVFLMPALTPVVLSISTIACMLLLHNHYSIYSVVYGYLLGGMLQVILLGIAVRNCGYVFSFKLFFRNNGNLVHDSTPASPIFSKDFTAILRKFPTTAMTVIVPIIGQQVAFYFSSTLSTGSSSAFSYAIVFWQLPVGVVINAIIGVHFAYLLTMIKEKNTELIAQRVHDAIYTLILWILPISLLFFFFSHAGVAVTIQRGNMNAQDSIITAQVLRGYAWGLLPFAIYLYFQKILIAFQKITSVCVFAIIFTSIDIFLSYVLIHTSLGVQGLSIAHSSTAFLVIIFMFRRIQSLTALILPVKKTLRLIIGILPLFAVSWFISNYTKDYWVQGSSIQTIVYFGVVSMIVLTILIVGYLLVGINLLHVLRVFRQGHTNHA